MARTEQKSQAWTVSGASNANSRLALVDASMHSLYRCRHPCDVAAGRQSALQRRHAGQVHSCQQPTHTRVEVGRWPASPVDAPHTPAAALTTPAVARKCHSACAVEVACASWCPTRGAQRRWRIEPALERGDVMRVSSEYSAHCRKRPQCLVRPSAAARVSCPMPNEAVHSATTTGETCRRPRAVGSVRQLSGPGLAIVIKKLLLQLSSHQNQILDSRLSMVA